MAVMFQLNRVFEEDLEASFLVDSSSGTFSTNGQQLVITHFLPFVNLKTLTSWTDLKSGTDANNYFNVDYRWSFDTATWTGWVAMPSDFNNFPDPNIAQKTWFHVRYTYVSDGLTTSTLQELNFSGTRKIDPIFQAGQLPPGKPVMFSNADTYKVFKLTDFQAFVANSIPLNGVDIKFRYTQTQGRTWSQWYDLTAPVLQSIKFDPVRFCNFEFGFNNTTDQILAIYDLELIGEFQNVTGNYAKTNRLGLKSQCNPITQPTTGPCDPNCPDGYLDQFGNVAGSCSTCCSSCSTSVSPWSLNPDCGDGCGPDSLYQANNNYGQLPMLKEYLDNAIGVRNGWQVQYAMTDPDTKGSDAILHEHQLFNVVAIKNLSIIVPDNAFPTQSISFSGFNLDLVQSFEIQILKQEFKQVFGVEFRPGKEDYLYLCQLNQMWEVDQIVPTRTAYLTETYWRVLLKKYNKRSNREHVNSQDQAWHDALTKNATLDDLFKVQVDAEIKQVTKDAQINVEQPSQQYTHTTSISFRNKVDSFVSHDSELIVNGTLTVSENQFNFPLTSKGRKLVRYKYKDQALTKSDNRAISFWFKTDDFDSAWEWKILNNYDAAQSLGYKLRMVNSTLELQINLMTYTLPVPTITKGVWYQFYVGINQQTSEIEIAVYRRQSEMGSSLQNANLVQVHRNVWNGTPQEFVHAQELFIGGVDLMSSNASGNAKRWRMTNIRLYNQVIERNKRNTVLNERIISDTQLTMLVDNAEPKRKDIPNYGNP